MDCPKSLIMHLFHGHVGTNRIDAALENTLGTWRAQTNHSEPAGGRSSTLWSAIEENQHEQNEESGVGDEPTAEDR